MCQIPQTPVTKLKYILTYTWLQMSSWTWNYVIYYISLEKHHFLIFWLFVCEKPRWLAQFTLVSLLHYYQWTNCNLPFNDLTWFLAKNDRRLIVCQPIVRDKSGVFSNHDGICNTFLVYKLIFSGGHYILWTLTPRIVNVWKHVFKAVFLTVFYHL